MYMDPGFDLFGFSIAPRVTINRSLALCDRFNEKRPYDVHPPAAQCTKGGRNAGVGGQAAILFAIPPKTNSCNGATLYQ